MSVGLSGDTLLFYVYLGILGYVGGILGYVWKVLLTVFLCLGEIFFSGVKDLAFFAKSLVHFIFLSYGTNIFKSSSSPAKRQTGKSSSSP